MNIDDFFKIRYNIIERLGGNFQIYYQLGVMPMGKHPQNKQGEKC